MAIYSSITRHRSYLRAIALAGAYLKNPQHLRALIDQAQLKTESGSSSYLARIRRGLGIPVRMLNAYIKGEYRDIPWRSLSMITAAIVYFVMPFDLMPDILPLIGFMDDVALLTWTLGQIKSDIDRFLAWEQQQLAISEDIIEVEVDAPIALPGPEAARSL